MIDVLHRERPGGATQRRYKELSRAWRRRFFPRRLPLLFWAIWVLAFVVTTDLHPGRNGMLGAGFGFGAIAATWVLLPEVFVPAHISRWQRGAWGEEMSALELKELSRAGWTVRHCVQWKDRFDHDHVVAQGAIFVLNTKNVKDSAVTIEGSALRVTHLEGEDGYLADRWAPTAAAEARSLKTRLSKLVGFPVHVYPVLVIWGQFDDGGRYLGDVAVVRGDRLVEWLREQPSDLLTEEKRDKVAAAVRALPRG